ncbi:hypothetical protein Tco_1539610 [Tanacetum coccineum]
MREEIRSLGNKLSNVSDQGFVRERRFRERKKRMKNCERGMIFSAGNGAVFIDRESQRLSGGGLGRRIHRNVVKQRFKYRRRVDVVFDGAIGGVRDKEVVVGEGVVVISSSLDMLTNNCLGGIMVSLIFLEGLDEEALVEFIVE